MPDDSAGGGRPAHSAEQILYLDFDGVVHHESVLRHPKRGIYFDPVRAKDRRLFEWAGILEDAIRPYPAVRIVLSTSWVRVLGYRRALTHLPDSLGNLVIGATYHRRFHRPEVLDPWMQHVVPRGQEVWRDVLRRRPTQWVAIDDDGDGWPIEAAGRLVLCDGSVGLSSATTQRELRCTLKRRFGDASDPPPDDAESK